MPEKTKAGHVGHCANARKLGQVGACAVQTRRELDELAIVLRRELVFLKCRRENANAQWLAEDDRIARACGAVAFDVRRPDNAEGCQPIDGLYRIDAMSSGDRNARFATNG